jgi:hypothetical protein
MYRIRQISNLLHSAMVREFGQENLIQIFTSPKTNPQTDPP